MCGNMFEAKTLTEKTWRTRGNMSDAARNKTPDGRGEKLPVSSAVFSITGVSWRIGKMLRSNTQNASRPTRPINPLAVTVKMYCEMDGVQV